MHLNQLRDTREEAWGANNGAGRGTAPAARQKPERFGRRFPNSVENTLLLVAMAHPSYQAKLFQGTESRSMSAGQIPSEYIIIYALLHELLHHN